MNPEKPETKESYTQREWEKKSAELLEKFNGKKIKVRRSSGDIDDGWELIGRDPNRGKMLVRKFLDDKDPGQKGQYLTKNILISEIISLNE